LQNDGAEVDESLKTFTGFPGAEVFLTFYESGVPNYLIGTKACRAVLQSWSFNVLKHNLGFLSYQGFPPVENRTWRGDRGT